MCSPKPNIAELPTYNSHSSLSKAFSVSSERPHTGLGGSPQSQEYEGVNAYCQMHCAPDETGLVLLDQSMNYLLHTRRQKL